MPHVVANNNYGLLSYPYCNSQNDLQEISEHSEDVECSYYGMDYSIW